jgi:hypothetical protein
VEEGAGARVLSSMRSAWSWPGEDHGGGEGVLSTRVFHISAHSLPDLNSRSQTASCHVMCCRCDRGDLRSLIHSGGLLHNRRLQTTSYKSSSSTGDSPTTSQGSPGVLSILTSPVASGSDSSGSSNGAGLGQGSPGLLSGGDDANLAPALHVWGDLPCIPPPPPPPAALPDLRTKSMSHDGSTALDNEAQVLAMQRRGSMPSMATAGGVDEECVGDAPCITPPTRPLLLPPGSPGGTSTSSYAWKGGIASEGSGGVTTICGNSSSTADTSRPPTQPQADMVAILLTA